MDRFEKKEMKKIRPIKNTWYDWLTNYIPQLIIKSVRGFKDKIVSLFKTNTERIGQERNQGNQTYKTFEKNFKRH